MTLVLAWLFVVFAAYGLSGAGVIRRLPLLAGVLLLIGALYTVRGLSIVRQIAQYLSTPRSPPLRVESPSWPVSATSAGRSKAGST